jgi:Protein of unknown function (DUF3455)
MRILSVAVAACLLPLVAACATQPAAPARVTVPDKLAPGPNQSLALIVPARGVQIYECRARREPTGGDEWVFVAPEADLLDARGNKIGRHYAGPHWEAADGSTIVGTVKERVDGTAGTRADVTYTADYYFFTTR